MTHRSSRDPAAVSAAPTGPAAYSATRLLASAGREQLRRTSAHAAGATDARSRIVHLTPKGYKLERTINREAKAVEQRVAELLGRRRFEQFRSALEALVGFINAESGRA